MSIKVVDAYLILWYIQLIKIYYKNIINNIKQKKIMKKFKEITQLLGRFYTVMVIVIIIGAIGTLITSIPIATGRINMAAMPFLAFSGMLVIGITTMLIKIIFSGDFPKKLRYLLYSFTALWLVNFVGKFGIAVLSYSNIAIPYSSLAIINIITLPCVIYMLLAFIWAGKK